MSSSTISRRAIVRCPFCDTANRVDLVRLADGPRCGGCQRPLRLDRPLVATDATLDQLLQGAEVPVLVDFYADWCGPCKVMAPTLDGFAHDRAGEVLVLKLDTDANPIAAQRFGIRGIPTLIAFRGGKESGRHVGATDRATLEQLAR
ncbi:MAG TPA: thioredoxin [Gemmatimonadales bacterium]|nr:thioredoxin [Gemmatimonadales bacterium]